MTKADIVAQIAKSTGIERTLVLSVVEQFMQNVKDSLGDNENVYLRGFGTFLVKKRARKIARNISTNTALVVPEHNIPAFRPAPDFMKRVVTKK